MKKLFILFQFFICLSVVAQDQKGLLIENFSSNKLNWPVNSTENIIWKVENGLYYRQNLKDLSYSTIKPVELDPAGNYWVYLDTKHLGGVTNQAFGLCFGAQDQDDEFAFVIALSGHYEIYKRENGKLTEVVKWTETDAIYKSESFNNSLWLIRQGKDWQFKINGKLVYTMPAQPLFGFNFGVTSSGVQTIGFDELNVNQVLERADPPIRTIVRDTALMKEDFSNNVRGWPESNDEYANSAVKDGKYHYNNYKLFGYSVYPTDLTDYEDYSITLTATHINGDSAYYGLCFGYQDVDNHYEFLITPGGKFSVFRFQAKK